MPNHMFHYYIQGFHTLVSPGHVADCDIYFRTMIHNIPQIRFVELWRKDRTYLGVWHTSNLPLETKREMIKFIKAHPKDWVRVYHNALD